MTNPPQGGREEGSEAGGPPSPPPSYGRPYAPPQPYGQQPYARPAYGTPGQPYGQHYGAPPPKSKVGLIVGVTAGILALIALAVVLALTLGGTVLDRGAVQRDVAQQFQEREGVAIDLSCAEDMKVDKGASYDCNGTTAQGEQVTLRITVTDERTPAYTWTEP
jgi:hypothetical protein